MASTTESSRRSGTFITSAMASRVMSSWVGPRPPQTMTPSLRARAVRKASTMRSWLSPTAWWKWEVTPAAARCSPSHCELVSVIWPRSSSVPTATISMRMVGQAAELVPSAAPRRGPGLGGPGRPPPVQVVLAAGEHGHGRGHPDGRGQHGVVAGQRRGQAHADGHVLEQGLDLGACCGPGWRSRDGRPPTGRRSWPPRGGR